MRRMTAYLISNYPFLAEDHMPTWLIKFEIGVEVHVELRERGMLYSFLRRTEVGDPFADIRL